MANKKLTNKSTTNTPEVRKDLTKSLRLVVAGIAAGAFVFYTINGGFNYHSIGENIGILLFIGIAYGMWTEHWLSK